jgi:hypothetical protein
MAFRVGQLVACINSEWPQSQSEGLATPVKGEVYTIREIYDDAVDGAYLRFEEIVNPPRFYDEGFFEKCFVGRCFRPLTQQNIDIVESLKAPPPADLDLEPLRPEEVAFQ